MDDQFHDFGDMTLQVPRSHLLLLCSRSVVKGLPKGARDLPSRMNDVRLAQAQMAQMDFRHRPGGDTHLVDFVRRLNREFSLLSRLLVADATDIRLMPNQPEMMRADQGTGALSLLRYDSFCALGPMKMHTPFAGMYANLSGHPGVPYVTSHAACKIMAI